MNFLKLQLWEGARTARELQNHNSILSTDQVLQDKAILRIQFKKSKPLAPKVNSRESAARTSGVTQDPGQSPSTTPCTGTAWARTAQTAPCANRSLCRRHAPSVLCCWEALFLCCSDTPQTPIRQVLRTLIPQPTLGDWICCGLQLVDPKAAFPTAQGRKGESVS